MNSLQCKTVSGTALALAAILFFVVCERNAANVAARNEMGAGMMFGGVVLLAGASKSDS
jgi:hypothetical protein